MSSERSDVGSSSLRARSGDATQVAKDRPATGPDSQPTICPDCGGRGRVQGDRGYTDSVCVRCATSAGPLLRAAAQTVEAVEAERDAALALVANSHEAARKMYRRGYLAGRASVGRTAVTNPERHARGEARQIMGVDG